MKQANLNASADKNAINERNPNNYSGSQGMPYEGDSRPETNADVITKSDAAPWETPGMTKSNQMNLQGMSSYATGGAIPDPSDGAGGGAIADNNGTGDIDTSNLSDALDTVDQIMQYGYQKSGLGGQNQQVASAIPTAPAGPGGDQPNQNPFPTATAPTPFGRRDPNQPLPIQGFGPGGTMFPVQSMEEGGPVEPMTGAIPTPENQHASEMTYLNADAAKRAIKNVTKRSSGTQAYDDGGDVEDANGNPGQPSTPAPTPPSPQPQQGGQNTPQILRLIQGAGAMSPQQAQQIEAQTGSKDPNVAKALAVAQLAKTQGPDAAFAYMQSLRKQYDILRTNAAVKASMGNLPLSTQSANDAMTNIVDGMDTRFTPAPGGKGVIMTSKKVGGGAQSAPTKGYADGGDVEDASGNEAIPETPPDQSGAQPNTAEAQANDTAFNEGVNKVLLSVPQYYQMLMGKEGMFDHLWNNTPSVVAKQVAEGPGMQPQAQGATDYANAISGGVNTQGADQMPNPGQRSLTGDIASAAQTAANPGASTLGSWAPPPQPAGGPAATAAAPPANGAPVTQQPAAPATPGQTSPNNAPVQFQKFNGQRAPAAPAAPAAPTDDELFGPGAAAAAQRMHPFAGDMAARNTMMAGEREKMLGYQAQQENQRIIAQGRVGSAEARAKGLTSAAGIRAELSNVNSARRAMTELQVAAMRTGAANDANLVRSATPYINSGGQVPEGLANALAAMVSRSQGEAPPQYQDFTKTPGVSQIPNQATGAAKQVQKGGMYYLTDQNGIVTKGPSPTPLQ